MGKEIRRANPAQRHSGRDHRHWRVPGQAFQQKLAQRDAGGVVVGGLGGRWILDLGSAASYLCHFKRQCLHDIDLSLE